MNQIKIIIATIKSWNLENAEKFKESNNYIITNLIDNDKDLNLTTLNEFKPDYIFFPHWSKKIPREIHENFKCILFHMTDLPFGRGGTPLQNLIELNLKNTKISAIEVSDEIDGGDVYIKESLSLDGSATEIYKRASKIIFSKMIPKIIKENITPKPQEGEVITFNRLGKEIGNLNKYLDSDLNLIYNKIRMLDAEGYPHAHLTIGKFKIQFRKALKGNKKIIADVEITEE